MRARDKSKTGEELCFTNRCSHPRVFWGQFQIFLPVVSKPMKDKVIFSMKHKIWRQYLWQHVIYFITHLMTALVVGAGRELPLLIVPFIWLSCCWGPPTPPPGAPAVFTEPRSCPFWLDKPKIIGFSVLAVLMFAMLSSSSSNEVSISL